MNGTYNHCNATCNGLSAHCGDGTVNTENGEVCDLGEDNGRTNCTYGEEECTVCTTECQENQGVTSYCGDGNIDGANNEMCDSGLANGETNCTYGEKNCLVCTTYCLQIQGATSYCGDGRIDVENGETCDEGALNGTYGHCSENCGAPAAHCGDGSIDTENGETCDDGELNGTYNHCNATCNGRAPFCGDGTVDTENGEVCDLGADNGKTNCAYGVEECTVCTTQCQEISGATSYCGDGTKDAANGEACDNGENNGKTNCSYGNTECTVCTTRCEEIQGATSYCGDGRIDGENGETCDEGALNGTYGHCSENCDGRAPFCGDGNINTENGEICDDGEANGTYNKCNTTCSGPASYCGDGVIDTENGETCDNGTDNGKTNCAYGVEECIVCTTQCQENQGLTSYCGDGTKDAANGEACDNGEANGTTTCAYGVESCLVCTTGCEEIKGATSYCGDGRIDAENGEACDEGTLNGTYGHCDSNCNGAASRCGDGELNTENGETCDDGELNGTYNHCNATCNGRAPFCGDGVTDTENGEACDNGTDNGGTNCAYGETECTLCSADCHETAGIASYCGDGVKDAANGEACDNGANNGATDCPYGVESCLVCTTGCEEIQGTTSYCGDGRIDEAHETCDEGSLNGSYGHCDSTCGGAASRCGDGELNTENGETCDDGELNGTYNHCNATCNGRAPFCGDGEINTENGEACDNGFANGVSNCIYGEEECTVCTTQCQENQGLASYCGDGVTDTENGEACDNGANNGTTDCPYGVESCLVCTTGCEEIQGTTSYCGDGRIDEAHETCDEGSLNGSYGHCDSTCGGAASRCGDGELNTENGETCDDGELNGTYNHCNATCNGRAPFCGDGRIDEDHEACDNGAENGAINCAYGVEECTVCTTLCQEDQGIASYCGDGEVDEANGEECDSESDNGETKCAYGDTECMVCTIQCKQIKGATSYCGDGRVDTENNETCDDGALNGTYGHCDENCEGRASFCGDGNIDTENGEICDDGEANGTYNNCNTTCSGPASHCGDGNVDAENGEVCDLGVRNGTTNCLYGVEECIVCTSECQEDQGIASYCGDGSVDGANNEICDRGIANGTTDCEYNETGCTVCTEYCKEIQGATSYCGDGRVDEDHEVCDFGVRNGTTNCLYGVEECIVCTSECQENQGITSYCGDGSVDEANGEECDNAENNGATDCTYGATECLVCTTRCKNKAGATSYCGDGRVDAENNETCDDGALNGTYGHCNSGCNGAAAHCGDGNVDTENGEECDDGELNGTYNKCNTTCSGVAAHCGDGNVDTENGEVCDNGTNNGETKCAYGETECTLCSTECHETQGETSYCGDGRIDEAHEVCDNGANNNATECAYGETQCSVCIDQCRNQIQGATSYCGDGRIDEAHEECDNGVNNGAENCAYGATECTLCTLECHETPGATSYCGDGRIDEANNEECDNAENNGAENCTYGATACTLCSTGCKPVPGATSYCGDGRVDEANGETCDEGTNLNGTYGHCSADCHGPASHCGDGNIDSENGETCDDGELNGTYGKCNSTCSGPASHCGDGNIDSENGEVCDSGADNGRENCAYGETECQVCTTECQPVAGETSYCGDSVTDAAHGEACDKGELNGNMDCEYNQTECLVCTVNCKQIPGVTSYCGDGLIDETRETCDNGFANGATECAYGEENCFVCTEGCENVPGATSYCGDGVTDTANGEECDNAENNDAEYCEYGQESCFVCTGECRKAAGATSYCGDGRIDEANGEECDEGRNLNGTYGHCSADCHGPASYCGDGEVDEANGETCDDGEENGSYGKCNTSCNGFASRCGDGILDTEHGEVCDRGFANGMTDCVYGELECILCSDECQEVSGFATYCGDGAVQANEVCDKAEPAVGEGEGIGAYCDDDCREILGSCGDGILQYNEVCDNAETTVGEGEGIGAYCDDDCRTILGFCGDNILQVNELCDNGENNGNMNCTYGETECTVCSTECQPEAGVVSYCGDGKVDGRNGEVCDNAEPEVGYGHGVGSKCDETCSSITTKVLCTGQTRCSDGESYIDCPAEGEPLYGQDGQYAGKESCQPHEFTKGETLEIEDNIYYEQVYDAVTGLRWLVTPSQATYEEAKALCENPEGYGGYTWRLPTIKELNSIVHLDISYPAVREAFFSFNDSSYKFWSDTKLSYSGAELQLNMENIYGSEPVAVTPEAIAELMESNRYVLDFGEGGITGSELDPDTDSYNHVICVSGGEYGATGEYTVVTSSNGDEIVSDSSTSLLWQKGFVNAKTIEQAFEYCENLEYAGYSDWRLPNRNEMMSLANFDSTGSSLTSFPGFATGLNDGTYSRYGYQMFWTSTFAPTYGGSHGFYIFEMVSGMIVPSSGYETETINVAAVRCVRSKTEPYPEGKNVPYCSETGFTPCEDPETGIVWSQVLNTDNDTLSHQEVALLCRQSNDGGFSQWRIPTVSELRTILGNSANLATGGACGVTDECSLSSISDCYDYELCDNGSGFESKFHDYSYMISSTLTGEGDNSSWMVNLRVGSLEPHSPQYIYYPTSSRCVLDESLPAAVGFFTDPQTGLSWSRLTGERNKAGAVKYCETLVQGGYDDWRIPTIEELRTLVRGCLEGGCDQSFNGIYSALNDSATLWSSTLTDVDDTISLNFFDFSTASQISEMENFDSVTAKLRCVRSDNYPSAVVTEFPYHDEESNLWWSEKSGPFSSYTEAEGYCADLTQSNYGGISDWEVPLLEEYATVLDCTLPNFGDAGCSEISFSSSRSLFGDTETLVSSSQYYYSSPEVIDFSTGELGVILTGQGFSGLIMSSNTYALLPLSNLYVRCVGFDESACEGDPCAGVEHSTGECTSEHGIPVCGCIENYNWNGEECVGATREVLCDSALPDNGWWNGQSYSSYGGRKYIYQTWNGEEWLPTTTTHYSVEPDESEGCTFKCLDSYVWNGEECATFPYIEPESGLTWSSYNQASVTYTDAVSYCEDLEEGGYDDWRLPTIDELRTLIRNCPGTQTGGACRVSDPNHLSYSDDWTDACSSCGSVGGRGYFSKLGGYDSSFWSSSVRSDSTDYNWVVNFTDASVGIYQNRNYAAPVARCVRGEYRGGYTDPDTGITWSSLKEDSDEDYLDWEQAFGYCENLEEGGYTDWRMPTIEELRTIVTNCPNVEPGGECGDYFYDGGFADCNCDESMGSKLGDGDDVMLWSSTIAQEDEISIGYVAGVDFYNNDISPFLTNGRASVHCIRSDLPVDTQRYGTCYGLPEHAEWNSYDLILQTWNGSEWLPAIPAAVFSENAGETQDCSFRCYYDELTWNGSECVCRNEGYFWNGMTCLPGPCEDTPGLCAGIEHGNGICKSGSSTEYSCGCDDGYAWNGSECEPLPECSPTSGTPCMDSESTLIWSAESAGKKIWYDAVAYCENLEEGGYTDWRMPDIDELRTLIQNCAYTEPGGACNVTTNCLYFYNEECFDWDLCYNACSYDSTGGHSKFGDASDLWSSSPIPDYGNGAWYVGFGNGKTGYDFKDDSYNVRCVRGGETDPCENNPCQGIANSNEQCSAGEQGGYVCGCIEGYFWNDEACVAPVSIGRICTGQTACYNNTEEIECPAEGAEFYGQDANYVSITGCKTRSYTTRTVSGDKIVLDKNTGLQWQQTLSTETMVWEDAVTYCENLTYAGYTDWHLATPDDMLTLHIEPENHFVASSDFTNWSADNNYWLNKENPSDTSLAFSANYYGFDDNSAKTDELYAICVRGNAPLKGSFTTETIGNDQIVVDSTTGFVWKLSYGNSWVSYCENLEYAGFSDWRLPNKNELASLLNFDNEQTSYGDYTDFPGGFHGNITALFRTSTSTNGGDKVSTLSFVNGEFENRTKSGYGYILCLHSDIVGNPTRQAACLGLPEGAEWNSISSITQTWNGSEWVESVSRDGVYNEEPSTTECRYKCRENYTWKESECVADTRDNIECTDLPANAQWHHSGTVDQTWGGSEWLPSSTGYYIESPADTVDCGFRCDDGYAWNGTECVETVCITANPCAGVQNSNGSCFGYLEGYSCVCVEGYFWDGEGCNPPLTRTICTGQDKCYNNSTEIECPAEGEDFYGQDAQYAALGTCTPHSFTVQTIADDNIVLDNNTGLQWQQLFSKDTFTWEEALSHCENLTYAGYSDWRVPSPKEFHTISDLGKTDPAFDMNYFTTDITDVEGAYLWTSKELESSASAAYYERYNNAFSFYMDKSNKSPVICVRGEELPEASFTTQRINGDVVVTDSTFGLMWQKAYKESKKTWQEALSYCENLTYAGYSDWRLPNIYESATLLNYDKAESPHSDFPNMPIGRYFWSSSTIGTAYAWDIYFGMDATLSDYYKTTNTNVVRCVRGGAQQGDTISFPYTDETNGLVWSEISEDGMNWSGAAEYCGTLNEGGSDNWRVPTVEELGTLVAGCPEGNCDPLPVGGYSIFDDTGALWSSDYTMENSIESAVFNVFDFGTASQTELSYEDATAAEIRVRCVRSTSDPLARPQVEMPYLQEYEANGQTVNIYWSEKSQVMTYAEAEAYCADLAQSNYGGISGWTIPDFDFIMLLLESGNSENLLMEPRGIFNDFCAFVSSYSREEGTHMYMDFTSLGYVMAADDGSSMITMTEEPYEGNVYVRCVYLDDQQTQTDPCNPNNPCLEVENSDGTCMSEGDAYMCGCEYGFEWDEETCAPAIIETDCTDLPEHAVWNFSGTVMQIWNGEDFEPEAVAYYSEYPEDEEEGCSFRCAANYVWNGEDCVETVCITDNPCAGIQNSNGSCFGYLGGYSCGCNDGYFWDGSACAVFPYTDPETNISWSAKSDDEMNWEEAGSYCEDLEEGGYDDWRLPTIDELRTIIQNCENTQPGGACAVSDPDYLASGDGSDDCYCDYLENNHGYYGRLGDDDSVWLWSSSALSDNTDNAWEVFFEDGSVWATSKTDYSYVRCVRGPDPCAFDPCQGIANSDGQCSADQEGGYVCGCDENYAWNGFECAETVCITDNPCVGIQNSNGSCSGTLEGYSCGCVDGYFWDGTSCVNPCISNPCTGITNGDDTCESHSPTDYSCGCNDGFYWTGEQCFVIPECSFTSGTPCTDSASNLLWSSKSAEYEILWENAGSYCENLTEGGFTDWRLPTIDELRTLIENCPGTQTGGACAVSDPDHLAESDKSGGDCSCSWSFQNNNGYYSKIGDTYDVSLWSSSVFDNTDSRWSVNFGFGSVETDDKNSVRCVREGEPVFDACIDNPCGAIANSDNQCSTTKLGGYSCGCNDGYFWTGSECAAFPYTDTETNLTWSSKSSVEMNRNNAVSYCENLTEGGYDDWHLPDIDELRTLVQNCTSTQTGGSCGVTTDCLEGSCNASCAYCESDSNGGHSKFGETDRLWSSSVRSDNSNHAWFINFVRGNVSYELVSNTYKVRCVREYDPCENNPCQGIANSDGQCSAEEQGGYVCGCVSGYIWNGSSCVVETPYTDPDTNITWSSLATDTMTWDNVVLHCENLEEGGFDDWRLPNIDELRTVIQNCEKTQSGGTCGVSDPDHLSSTGDGNSLIRCACSENNNGYYSKLGDDGNVYLWSSSTTSDITDSAWGVDFGNGCVDYTIKTSHAGSVRCVR